MTKKELIHYIEGCDDDAEVKIIFDCGKGEITGIDTSESNEIIIECEATEIEIEF